MIVELVTLSCVLLKFNPPPFPFAELPLTVERLIVFVPLLVNPMPPPEPLTARFPLTVEFVIVKLVAVVKIPPPPSVADVMRVELSAMFEPVNTIVEEAAE